MHLQWDTTYFTGGDGVLTGCDENHEWMLKWWWTHYSGSNHLPVTFLDFGMSTSAKIWCKKRGLVIPITMEESAFYSKEKLSIETQKKWETFQEKTIWKSRKPWCLKPLGLLKTPYARSAWIDLDCKVVKSIEPLIQASKNRVDIAIVKEISRLGLLTTPYVRKDWKKLDKQKLQSIELQLSVLEGSSKIKVDPQKKSIPRNIKKDLSLAERKVHYNTGIFSFKHSSPIILKWAQNMLEYNNVFLGDQNAFNQTLFENTFRVKELSPFFNQQFLDDIFPETLIIHYSSPEGKHEILRSI